jgi:5-methylcytosine-specific restriction enzyme subunit McrC
MNITHNISLTLFEHEAKEYRWTDLDLVELAKLSQMAGVEVLRATVIGGQRVLQATQHIGVFCFRQTIVQVLPKIYRSSTIEMRPTQEREATQNLLFLLSYAMELPVREYGLAPLTDQQQDWFEGLISIFAMHLLEEWQRGPYRHYQEIKDTLPLLKGKLDVASQLRHPEARHRFTVTYDEYTADVPLNRVFRFVVERLWHITRNANNKRHLARLRQWMEEITLQPQMAVSDTKTIVLTRLNQRFASLLELARLFLDHGALQLSLGNTSTYAFVIDMNQLFESFLTNFICRHQREILPLSLQQCELRPQSVGMVRYLATHLTSGKNVFRLKPDLVIYDRMHDCFPLLIDMKYKRIANKDPVIKIASDDFYQMFAYAQRYHCRHVLLLYPQTVDLSEPIYQPFALTGYEKVIVVATVDLCKDLQRKEEQQKLKDTLRSLLRLE